MHMNKKIKHPHKIGILMWFSQLHAYIHRQNQPTISNINHRHYNGINQNSEPKTKKKKKNHKSHKYTNKTSYKLKLTIRNPQYNQ